MKIETVIYKCDVCKKEVPFADIQNLRLPVVVSCSQDDGAAHENVVNLVHMDICKSCLLKSAVIKYGFRSVEGFVKGHA